MKKDIAICWFRQDLRLFDNPAFVEAAKHENVMALFVFDNDDEIGAASKLWLHHSLNSLNKSLDGNLLIHKGNYVEVISDIVEKYGVNAVYWNRCYEPWRIKKDTQIKQALKLKNVNAKSFNGSLLWEPWDIKKDDGDPYKVFTPFYRKCVLKGSFPEETLEKPEDVNFVFDKKENKTINSLKLLPDMPWAKEVIKNWNVGELGAQERFQSFIDSGLNNYKKGRDLPAKEYVSRLAPHLHFGEISPRQVYHAIRSISDDENSEHFCKELAWREFSYSTLYYNPKLPEENLRKKFDCFPWERNDSNLLAWQKGKTGIPIVDAGMRQLWQTGYMHNRVRMIVASFLIKNLLLDWRLGQEWFWDTLFDADLANNSASWQWVAGSGADAAPYFRIFNPVTQGQKFDSDGEYIRRFVPELSQLPNKHLFSPWLAPQNVLICAKVKLGKDYPYPIVDLKYSRQRALEAFKKL